MFGYQLGSDILHIKAGRCAILVRLSLSYESALALLSLLLKGSAISSQSVHYHMIRDQCLWNERRD